MLNEFHSNNRSSTCSNASKSTTSSHSGIRFDLPVGHEFASNILVADLAIRSTAYKPPSPPPPPPPPKDDTVKAKRRVTFNLDDIQIQTIPAYDSTISLSSNSSSIEEDPIMMRKLFQDTPLVIKEEEKPIHQEPPPAPPISQPSTSERISKKASYDALQKRKQYRRDHQQPTIKPGYWYPLASTRTHMLRQPLPTMRTLEMTEKLINESIQREIALNPNLTYTPPSPSPSPHSDIEEPTTGNMNVLISDTEDEEEEDSVQHDTTHTTASNTVILTDEESLTTAVIPQSKDINHQEQESDFTRSIYNELAKRHSGQSIPTNEYQPTQLLFPFEQNLIPISANKDVLIISPPPSPPLLELHDDEEPIWIDHPSLLINASKSKEHRGLFFVKVLNTESLDFPIDDDDTNAYCTVTYKGTENKSKKQTLSHSMQIQHELKIEDVDPNEQIVISIHVDENNKKSHTNNHWYHRIRSAKSDLERYIHEKDGAICQTSFLPSRFIIDGLSDQTATLMLVNNWYRPSSNSKDSHHTNTTANSLLKRSTSWKKKRTSITREKAVGKIYIQCLYIMVPKYCKEVPQTMEEAIEALNAKRFHQTDWQSGYLLQLGGNTKILTKRYFTLTGGSLFAYSDDNIEDEHSNYNLLYKIPLTRAKQLICDNKVISESSIHTTSPTTLLNQLDSMVITEPSTTNYNIENGFQIVFDNGESIHFSCETIEERSRWIAVLEVMICKLPKLPEWIIS